MAIDSFIHELSRKREEFSCVFPSAEDTYCFIHETLALMFPHFSKKCLCSAEQLTIALEKANNSLLKALAPLASELSILEQQIADRFFDALPEIYETICLDAQAHYDGDPAAKSIHEVILAYPGFLAVAVYRIAHFFSLLEIPLFPRLLSEYAHSKTGIDIHPGAKIGKSFCIDHGTGVVIGETAIIGNKVKFYQGVTLGARSVMKTHAHKKRHPTIEDEVIVYSSATILGGETVVGRASIIGGNVWLTKSVPPNSRVYYQETIEVKS